MTIQTIILEAQEKISQIEGCPVTVHYIKLQPDLKKPRTDLLKRAVSEAFQIPWQTLIVTKSRKRDFVLPKKIFLYLNQIDLKVGPVRTAEHLGFDHTMAYHHKKSISDLMDARDEEVVIMVGKVREVFNNLKSAV